MTDPQELLKKYKTIAVVGLSDDPTRPSHTTTKYMLNQGYNIIPVNPKCQEILGRKCYANLSDIPEKVDIVNVFRKAEDVLPIAEEAIKIGAKVLWLQLGIINQEAATKATKAGLEVVMDRCVKIEHAYTR